MEWHLNQTTYSICCCSCKIIVIKMTMIWGYMHLAVKNVFQDQQKVKKFYFVAAVLHKDVNGKDFNLQSWTKVLGTVLRYAYFSVISRFPLKTVHHFRNFIAVLPPPTLYKVETRKKFWIHASNIQHCLWGEGRGWTCVNWKTPQKRKSVPRLLSMIVVSIA